MPFGILHEAETLSMQMYFANRKLLGFKTTSVTLYFKVQFLLLTNKDSLSSAGA